MPDSILRAGRIPVPNPVRPMNQPLSIDSIVQFGRQQAEIMQRLNSMRNGVTLFTIHPVQALLDAGVSLAPPVARGLWEALDTIEIPVPAAYRELQKSAATQRVNTTIEVPSVRGGQ